MSTETSQKLIVDNLVSQRPHLARYFPYQLESRNIGDQSDISDRTEKDKLAAVGAKILERMRTPNWRPYLLNPIMPPTQEDEA
jgi:hypothetical protein